MYAEYFVKAKNPQTDQLEVSLKEVSKASDLRVNHF